MVKNQAKNIEPAQQGGNEQLDFKQFLDALQINNVCISPELAQNIFNQIDANKNGFITATEMDGLLTKLDAMNNQEMLNLCMTRKVFIVSIAIIYTIYPYFSSNIELNDPDKLGIL